MAVVYAGLKEAGIDIAVDPSGETPTGTVSIYADQVTIQDGSSNDVLWVEDNTAKISNVEIVGGTIGGFEISDSTLHGTDAGSYFRGITLSPNNITLQTTLTDKTEINHDLSSEPGFGSADYIPIYINHTSGQSGMPAIFASSVGGRTTISSAPVPITIFSNGSIVSLGSHFDVSVCAVTFSADYTLHKIPSQHVLVENTSGVQHNLYLPTYEEIIDSLRLADFAPEFDSDNTYVNRNNFAISFDIIVSSGSVRLYGTQNNGDDKRPLLYTNSLTVRPYVDLTGTDVATIHYIRSKGTSRAFVKVQ